MKKTKKYTLEELKDIQRRFDKKFFGEYDINPEGLLFTIIGLCGEVGEAANIIKKYYRKAKYKGEVKEDRNRNYLKEIKEELTDVLIYLLIFANKLNWDIGKSFLKKIKKNEKRFKRKRKYISGR